MTEGEDRKPVEVSEVNGEAVYLTGDDKLDEFEEKWANQRTIEEYAAEYYAQQKAGASEETDVLEEIGAEIDGRGGRD